MPRVSGKSCGQSRNRLFLLMICMAVVLAPGVLLAQIGGQGALQGRVTDPSGAVIGQGKLGSNSRAVRWLAGNWDLSWIATYSAGTPLEINSSGCTAPGQSTCFPNYASGFSGSVRQNGGWGNNVLRNTASSIPFLKASAFSDPSETQIGDVSRTAPYGLFGPGGYEIDAGLRRTFPIAEGVNFVFSGEAFNVLNNVNFGGVNTNISSSNFGTVSRQTNTSRDWQFSGKIEF